MVVPLRSWGCTVRGATAVAPATPVVVLVAALADLDHAFLEGSPRGVLDDAGERG